MSAEQDIIKALGKHLKTLYPEARVYQNDQEQGIETPCFFIALVNLDSRLGISNHFWRELPLQVSAIGWTRAEALGVAQTLMTELLHLPLLGEDAGSIRGYDMSALPNGDDMHIQVTYRFQLRDALPKPTMEELHQQHFATEGTL